MSSKFRNTGDKEKWVSGNSYKFDTPRNSSKGRQKAQIGASPWTHKQLAHKKPHKVDPIKKTPMKKKTAIKNSKAFKKEMKALLKTDKKIRKSPRVVVTPIDHKVTKTKRSRMTKLEEKIDRNGDESPMKNFDLFMDISDEYLKGNNSDIQKPSSGKRSSEKRKRSVRIRNYTSQSFLNGESKKVDKLEDIVKLSDSFSEDVNIEVESAEEATEEDLSKAKIKDDTPSSNGKQEGEVQGRSWCTIA